MSKLFWIAGLSAGMLLAEDASRFERMQFHHPGLVSDLSVGIWAWPLPMDADGDGDLDLIVSSPDTPYHRIVFFENPASKGAKDAMPVFKAGKVINDSAKGNVVVSGVDGRPLALIPGTAFTHVLVNGLKEGTKVNCPVNKGVRGNVWRLADYDGDGAVDIVIGVGSWAKYGWADAYDKTGRWTNENLHGWVYWAKNTGTTASPVYAAPVQIDAGGKPIDVFGNPCMSLQDFDNDGDLDILCGEFLDGFTYFENIGTRTAPLYAAGRRVKGTDGKPITMDLEMITPTAMDWDGDGDIDLVCGEESGRVAFIGNTGKFDAERTPLFEAPRWFQAEATNLKFGVLVTPCACDWDGDGDIDLVCGNSAGYVGFLENLSGKGEARPKWANPVCLSAGGETIRIQAGANGSIQGPAEAKWGYTTLSVADWDGDGDLDILLNSILGDVLWYENIGTRTAPRLAAAKPVEVEWEGAQPALAWGWRKPKGKALLTQWRTTPVACDWNKDGLVDLLMLDQQGYFCFFERAKHGNKLVLLAPRRVFLREDGKALQLAAGKAGGSGRRKICMGDWDGDGKMDFLANSRNVEFWRQVRAENGTWTFKNMGDVDCGRLAGHTTSPTLADFDNNGIPDLVIGAEDGFFYFLKNPRAEKGAVK